MYWDAKSVTPLADYRIYVELENGIRGAFDLKPYLDRGVMRELRDVHYFQQVGIVFGAVTWPHGQDIAPDTLLAGLVPEPPPVHHASSLSERAASGRCQAVVK